MPRGADILIDTLRSWGVDVIFGLPGDGINGIMEALRTRQDAVRFVQVRHEESAALMACGYAKFTGRLGVCLATSGPGGLHLINGLYDAKLDGAPVLAITGHQFHDLIDTHTQQDVDLCRAFQDVTVYNTRIMGAAHVENVTHLACRTALAKRGVAHLNFPVDLQDEELDEDPRSRRNVLGHTSSVATVARVLPSPESLQRAADVLNSGHRTVILAGRGALRAGRFVEAVADRLAAPIVKPLLGKGVVPDSSPFTTGGVGLLGTAPSADALHECDTLLIVGSSFPYIEHYPKPGAARAVQIDDDPTRIALRYPVEVGLVGDSAEVLEQLLPLLPRREDRSFLETAQRRMADWRDLLDSRGSVEAVPMKPQVVARALGELLRPDAIVTSDSGTVTTWWARQIPAQGDQMYSCSGTLATMACGLPYAIGAQVAYPGRQVVAFVGDGALSMLMAELATAAKYDLAVKVVVVKNNILGQIKWEQMAFLGNPDFGIDLYPIDFVKVAEACGVAGFHLEQPKDCERVLREALGHPGPALVEAVVDPLEPPLPGHITLDQARKMTQALLRGEPDRGKILKNVLADTVRSMV